MARKKMQPNSIVMPPKPRSNSKRNANPPNGPDSEKLMFQATQTKITSKNHV
tara:strand:- start:78 stop:233 length:156 start_codon:yes stop_codon:yes gene_type:complete